jgi:uncharacterized cupin superfamily protein
MELSPGVFVSNIDTTDWELDDDPAGESHLLFDRAGVSAGLQRFPPGGNEPVEWTLPAREVIYVLEGEARIEIEGGPTLHLKVGDMASMPKGAKTTWHLTLPYKETWVLA